MTSFYCAGSSSQTFNPMNFIPATNHAEQVNEASYQLLSGFLVRCPCGGAVNFDHVVSQNYGLFAPLNVSQKSPNFACKPDLEKNFIFNGLHFWAWQNASVAPPTNFQKALTIGVSLSQANEIWYTHVSCQDAQKSLWQPCSKLNRKSAILISLVNFGFFLAICRVPI